MAVALRVCVTLFCGALLFYVVHLVAKERLLLRYSLLWLGLAFVLLACALFPDGIISLSTALGFETASNFIFFVGLFCLMAISLSLSVIASGQSKKIKELAQRVALVEHQALEGKGEKDEKR